MISSQPKREMTSKRTLSNTIIETGHSLTLKNDTHTNKQFTWKIIEMKNEERQIIGFFEMHLSATMVFDTKVSVVT